MYPMVFDAEAGRTYWWCCCGHSKSQPFCDGCHKGGGSAPLKYTADQSGEVLFCVCKRTASPPLCDGSHGAAAPARHD